MKIFINKKAYTILILLTVLVANQYAQSPQLTFRVGIYDENVELNNLSNRFVLEETQKIFLNAIKKRTGDEAFVKSIIEVNYYTTNEVMLKNLMNKNYDFISISTWSYYKYELEKYVKPLLVSSINNNSKFEKYLLLTNADIKAKTIADIEDNTRILIPKTNSRILTKNWINVLLASDKNRMKGIKSKIDESSENEMSLLISLCLKKIQFMVVRESSYNDACVLNPQIKKLTRIINYSGNYLTYILVQRKDIDINQYKKLWDEALNLNNTTEGQQILDIMNIKRVFLIKEEDLYETKKLLSQYFALSKRIR